jgi:hypothetical protein
VTQNASELIKERDRTTIIIIITTTFITQLKAREAQQNQQPQLWDLGRDLSAALFIIIVICPCINFFKWFP